MKPEEIPATFKVINNIAAISTCLVFSGVIGISVVWGGWLFFWSSFLTAGVLGHSLQMVFRCLLLCRLIQAQPQCKKCNSINSVATAAAAIREVVDEQIREKQRA